MTSETTAQHHVPTSDETLEQASRTATKDKPTARVEKTEKPENLSEEEKKERDAGRKLASKIADIVASSLERIKPITNMITQHLDRAEADQRNKKLNEEELVKNVKPLIEQGSEILNETHGSIKALDPTGKISRAAQNKSKAHQASPEEYYLAEKLTELTEHVQKAIDKAKMTIKDMPRAKKELSPLLVMLQNPLAQIIAAVGLLLTGVLGLVRQLLAGLGLGGLIDKLLGAIGVNKLVESIGLGGLLGKK